MRTYSLAYLTTSALRPADMVSLAAELGYGYVGLRLLPNAAGAPQQHLIGDAVALRETRQRIRDTGVGVFDLEIIRIGSDFDAFLSEQGELEDTTAIAVKRVIAWQIEQAMLV